MLELENERGEKNPPKYAVDKCKQGSLLTEYFNNLSNLELLTNVILLTLLEFLQITFARSLTLCLDRQQIFVRSRKFRLDGNQTKIWCSLFAWTSTLQT